MRITISPYQSKDRTAVIQLWEDCGLTVPWNDPSRDIERKLTEQPELFLLAFDENNHLVGSIMAGFDGHRGAVNYLAVLPDHRNEGVAKQLMNQIENLLIEAGCPKINVMVRTSNLEASGFYEAIGYEPQDIIVLGKRLIDD